MAVRVLQMGTVERLKRFQTATGKEDFHREIKTITISNLKALSQMCTCLHSWLCLGAS